MKYLALIGDITPRDFLTGEVNGDPLTHIAFILRIVLTDPVWAKRGIDGLHEAIAIKDECVAALKEERKYLALEDAPAKSLADACKHPNIVAVGTVGAMTYLPFFEATQKISPLKPEVSPSPKKEEAAPAAS